MCKEKWVKVTSEVPQDFVLILILWNVFFDNVFPLKLTGTSNLIVYANDLAMMILAADKYLQGK